MAKVFFICLAAAWLCGCADAACEAASGASVRQLLAAQRLHAAPATGPQGLDGPAARGAQERYERSFAQPQPVPALMQGAKQ